MWLSHWTWKGFYVNCSCSKKGEALLQGMVRSSLQHLRCQEGHDVIFGSSHPAKKQMIVPVSTDGVALTSIFFFFSFVCTRGAVRTQLRRNFNVSFILSYGYPIKIYVYIFVLNAYIQTHLILFQFETSLQFRGKTNLRNSQQSIVIWDSSP